MLFKKHLTSFITRLITRAIIFCMAFSLTLTSTTLAPKRAEAAIGVTVPGALPVAIIGGIVAIAGLITGTTFECLSYFNEEGKFTKDYTDRGILIGGGLFFIGIILLDGQAATVPQFRRIQ